MTNEGSLSLVAAFLLGAMLGGCASSGPTLPEPQHLASIAQEQGDPTDPLEKQNRATFEANQKFNQSVIYPIAEAYHDTVPEPVRDSVDSFATNLSEPMVFANNLLQLRFNAAAKTFTRFAVNSTVGIGGLFDVAAAEGLAHQSGDFGQTLYVWGARESNYVVLPLIGPTNMRDTVGTVVELVAPLPAGGLFPTRIAAAVNNVSTVGQIAGPFTGLNKVGQLKDLEENSLDFYTMLRSFVQQKREAELQEALATSALTAPRESLPGADVEPIMMFSASPAFADSMTDRPRKPAAPKTAEVNVTAEAPAASQGKTSPSSTVIIGEPKVE